MRREGVPAIADTEQARSSDRARDGLGTHRRDGDATFLPYSISNDPNRRSVGLAASWITRNAAATRVRMFAA